MLDSMPGATTVTQHGTEEAASNFSLMATVCGNDSGQRLNTSTDRQYKQVSDSRLRADRRGERGKTRGEDAQTCHSLSALTIVCLSCGCQTSGGPKPYWASCRLSPCLPGQSTGQDSKENKILSRPKINPGSSFLGQTSFPTLHCACVAFVIRTSRRSAEMFPFF